MSHLDYYDRHLPRDPRNMVGAQVAKTIHARTDLKPDFTTSMHGQSAWHIAQDVHNGSNHDDLPMRKFKKHWRV